MPCGIAAQRRRQWLNRPSHSIERPLQVDRSGPRRAQYVVRRPQRVGRSIGGERHRQAIRRGSPDERRAAHLHGPDGMRRFPNIGQAQRYALVRQLRLIDDFDCASVRIRPQGVKIRCVH